MRKETLTVYFLPGRYDDLYQEENAPVALALKRLSPKESYDRIFRIRRAVQLSYQHKLLPKDQWTKAEEVSIPRWRYQGGSSPLCLSPSPATMDDPLARRNVRQQRGRGRWGDKPALKPGPGPVVPILTSPRPGRPLPGTPHRGRPRRDPGEGGP